MNNIRATLIYTFNHSPNEQYEINEVSEIPQVRNTTDYLRSIIVTVRNDLHFVRKELTDNEMFTTFYVRIIYQEAVYELQQLTGTLNPSNPQPPMARHYNNLEWLLKENKDILEKFDTPEVHTISIKDSVENYASQYKQFGINLLLSEEHTTPRELPENEDIRSVFRSINFLTNPTTQIEVKIPGNRNTYMYYGRMMISTFTSDRQMTKPDILIQLPKITLDNSTYEAVNVAAVYNNIIVIWIDLKERTLTNKALLRYILKEALPHISPTTYPRQKPDSYEQQQMFNLLRDINNKKFQYLNNSLKEAQRSQANALSNYIEYSRSIVETSKQIEREKLNDTSYEKLSEEFVQYATKATKIKKWEVENKSMRIDFHNLNITYKQETIAIPPLTVTINMATGSFSAVASNEECKVSPLHPHVFENGNACLGNFTNIFPRVVSSGQLAQVCEILIQFFETYNEDSPVPGGTWVRWRQAVKQNKNSDEIETEFCMQEWLTYVESVHEEPINDHHDHEIDRITNQESED